MSDLKCGRKTNLCSTCPNRSPEEGFEVEYEGGGWLFFGLAVAVIALAVVLIVLFADRMCS